VSGYEIRSVVPRRPRCHSSASRSAVPAASIARRSAGDRSLIRKPTPAAPAADRERSRAARPDEWMNVSPAPATPTSHMVPAVNVPLSHVSTGNERWGRRDLYTNGSGRRWAVLRSRGRDEPGNGGRPRLPWGQAVRRAARQRVSPGSLGQQRPRPGLLNQLADDTTKTSGEQAAYVTSRRASGTPCGGGTRPCSG
jgi:hypothetical protein